MSEKYPFMVTQGGGTEGDWIIALFLSRTDAQLFAEAIRERVPHLTYTVSQVEFA